MANHPIFYPTFHGQLEAVEKLLRTDPNLVNVRDAKNLKPLHVAASRGQDKVARLLLDVGADVNGPREGDEWTPLVFASYRGHLNVVKVLLDYGAEVTEVQGNPLHFAGQRGHKEICRLLVEHGAVDDLVGSDDPDLQEVFRFTYSYDHIGVESVLQKRPELIQAKDIHDRSLMHGACTFGDTRTVRVLLRHGASLDIRDSRGQSPLDCATAHRQHRIVKILSEIDKDT